MTDYYLTKDIKISSDNGGCYTATHKWQGILVDCTMYESRTECRRDAVAELKEIKEYKHEQCW